jgi:hypothetical protein
MFKKIFNLLTFRGTRKQENQEDLQEMWGKILRFIRSEDDQKSEKLRVAWDGIKELFDGHAIVRGKLQGKLRVSLAAIFLFLTLDIVYTAKVLSCVHPQPFPIISLIGAAMMIGYFSYGCLKLLLGSYLSYSVIPPGFYVNSFFEPLHSEEAVGDFEAYDSLEWELCNNILCYHKRVDIYEQVHKTLTTNLNISIAVATVLYGWLAFVLLLTPFLS